MGKDPGVSRYGNNPETLTILGDQDLKANNDACIACHTHVAVDITFDKAYKLKLTATAGNSTRAGTGSLYTVGNSGVEGNVIINVYGNQSGQTWAVGDQSITWNPTEDLWVSGDKAKPINELASEAVDDEANLIS